MVRRRWPDVLLVLGVLALLAGGTWVLWGDDLRAWWHPQPKQVEPAQHQGGLT